MNAAFFIMYRASERNMSAEADRRLARRVGCDFIFPTRFSRIIDDCYRIVL